MSSVATTIINHIKDRPENRTHVSLSTTWSQGKEDEKNESLIDSDNDDDSDSRRTVERATN